MTRSISFALNHIAAPRLAAAEFFGLTRKLGLDKVEIRNDLKGAPILDGTDAATIRREAQAEGVEILTVNALQRFNEWTPARETEAYKLSRYAKDCGASALVLVPVNDAGFRPSESERLTGLRQALRGLFPILKDAGIQGFVEPLGFAISSLRMKGEAIEAIDDVGGSGVLRLVHDTFHHHLAGESEMFPARTGLVHISGVTDPRLRVEEMLDAHRVLVDDADRLGNLAQIKALRHSGYDGAFSFEPFAENVQQAADLAGLLATSIDFIEEQVPMPGANGTGQPSQRA
jgi:2-keto-myo-inositol isomerase